MFSRCLVPKWGNADRMGQIEPVLADLDQWGAAGTGALGFGALVNHVDPRNAGQSRNNDAVNGDSHRLGAAFSVAIRARSLDRERFAKWNFMRVNTRWPTDVIVGLGCR